MVKKILIGLIGLIVLTVGAMIALVKISEVAAEKRQAQVIKINNSLKNMASRLGESELSIERMNYSGDITTDFAKHVLIDLVSEETNVASVIDWTNFNVLGQSFSDRMNRYTGQKQDSGINTAQIKRNLSKEVGAIIKRRLGGKQKLESLKYDQTLLDDGTRLVDVITASGEKILKLTVVNIEEESRNEGKVAYRALQKIETVDLQKVTAK